MEKVVKKITKKITKLVLNVETNLINKEEVFKMCALAQATSRPLLLVGPPGAGKTKAIIDYAKAWVASQNPGGSLATDFMEKVFILETDEGTKASEVKGMCNLSKLLTENKYELLAPITEAEIVIVNEIDKASSNIRNSLLGIMNEKFLFSGENKIHCKYKLFVGTCNEIPKDELNSPFWDRFVLKYQVMRISAGEMIKYYNKGGKDYKESTEIGMPDRTELDSLSIPTTKLEKFLEIAYSKTSDRTLTFIPTLTKAVSFIWDSNIDKSLVKVADLMLGKSAGSELQSKLMTPEVRMVISKVEMLQSYNDSPSIDIALKEIEDMITGYAAAGSIDEDQVKEIDTTISYVLEHHPVKIKEREIDNVLNEIDLDSDFEELPATQDNPNTMYAMEEVGVMPNMNSLGQIPQDAMKAYQSSIAHGEFLSKETEDLLAST